MAHKSVIKTLIFHQSPCFRLSTDLQKSHASIVLVCIQSSSHHFYPILVHNSLVVEHSPESPLTVHLESLIECAWSGSVFPPTLYIVYMVYPISIVIHPNFVNKQNCVFLSGQLCWNNLVCENSKGKTPLLQYKLQFL